VPGTTAVTAAGRATADPAEVAGEPTA
jgi:hypothetical protein